MPTITDIRAQFPQYSDLDDQQLLDGLHRRFYSDMPRDEFEQRVGYKREPEPTTADAVAETGEFAVRGFNKGLVGIATAPYRALDWVGEKITGGDFMKNIEELPAYRPFLKQPEARTTAGRYAGAAGEAVGASAIPTAGMVSAAPRLAALAPTTTSRAIGQTVGRQIAASPRAAVAADVISATGAGVGQQAAADAGFGPGGQMVAGTIGGMSPFALAAAGRKVATPIQRAFANQGEAGAYGSVAEDLGMSVDDFAESVARGTAHAQTVPINQMVLDVLGEEMVRAGGNVRQAQQAAVTRLAREQRVTPQTAADQIRTLTQQYADNQLMLGEFPATIRSDMALRGPRGGLKQPQNVDLEALNRADETVTQATLDYLANAGNRQSGAIVRNAIGDRQPRLAESMRGTFENMAPRIDTQTGGPPIGNVPANQLRPANIIDSEAMIENARRAGSQAYRAAYSAPINNSIAVAGLPRLLEWYARRTAGRSGEAAQAMRRALDEFFITTPNGQRLAMMDLQQLQDARGAVRNMITKAVRDNDNNIVNALQPFYSRVTRMMEAMSPAWARANQQWSDMNFQRIAAELGDAFKDRAGPAYRQQLREFQRLAPEAQDIVRIHVLQQTYDDLDNLPDTHTISKLFSKDHVRNMIRELFGRDALVDFVRAVREQRVAESSQGMLRNSATHRRGVTQKQKDAETGLTTAIENANAQGVKKWLLEKAMQIAVERRNRPMARILTTPMSDTANVAMHLERMRNQQNRLQRFSRPVPQRRFSIGAHGATPGVLEEDSED